MIKSFDLLFNNFDAEFQRLIRVYLVQDDMK